MSSSNFLPPAHRENAASDAVDADPRGDRQGDGGAVLPGTEVRGEGGEIIGRRVGRFEILAEVGRGGMGIVYAAWDQSLGRKVALKMLRSEAAATGGEGGANPHSLGGGSPLQHDPLVREARAAAALDHPYVCKVFEIVEHQNALFIAMEFLEGETLSECLKAGLLPFSDALRIAIEIGEALAEAHKKGIIHCDLKPGNVLITRSGHVKLMDFGLARRVRPSGAPENELTLTLTSNSGEFIGGTIPYMAPEHATGEPLDARTDVFAIGIMYYELFCGMHPFRKNSTETTIAAILYEDPKPLGHYWPEAPGQLGDILRRALAKKPAERYPSAEELVCDLRKVGTTQTKDANVRHPAIAILPFRDISPDKDQEYFCEGLAEELIVALARVPKLRVVARSASFRFRNATIGLKEIGRSLEVDRILEGSVRKAGNRVRVVVNLVDLETESSLWSERYDRDLIDIFEIEDEIARTVVEKLRLLLALPESEPRLHTAPQNIQAFESYLRARYFWNKRTEADLRLSIKQFERALAEDAGYSLAHAGLADAWVTLALYGAVPPVEAMSLARRAADTALTIQPKQAEALTSRACIRAVFDWDWSSAALEFEAAVKINPRYAQARQWYALHCLVPIGQFARAREQLMVALELEPVSMPLASSLGVLDFLEGNYAGAIRRFQAVLELDESFYLARFFLGQAYSELEMHTDAMRELKAAATLTGGSSESVAALACALARAGKTEEAGQRLRELSDRSASQYVSPVLVAQIQLSLDQEDDAMASLELAFRLRSTDIIWVGVRPTWKRLRRRERLGRILRDAGMSIRTDSSRATTDS